MAILHKKLPIFSQISCKKIKTEIENTTDDFFWRRLSGPHFMFSHKSILPWTLIVICMLKRVIVAARGISLSDVCLSCCHTFCGASEGKRHIGITISCTWDRRIPIFTSAGKFHPELVIWNTLYPYMCCLHCSLTW